MNWPSGEMSKYQLPGTWVENQSATRSRKFRKSGSEEEEFELLGEFWRIILGWFIFAVRIKNSPSREKKEKKPKSTKAISGKEEKIEVGCPTCDRRLRVPGTYTGAVRCPECETKFDVEAKEEIPPKENSQQTEPKQTATEDLFSSSDNDILGCPKCTRKLKVPYDKRPARARCPACSTVFEARKK